VLLAAALAARAAACKSKGAAPAAGRKPTIAAKHWITPLMTAPPPRPTVTMWPAVTRAPQLPE
jgi:hypothetical protein